MVKAKDFKFGTQLGFAKADHKITPRGKSGRDLRLEKQPNIWDSRLIFLQWPGCPLSVIGASCWYQLPVSVGFAKQPDLSRTGTKRNTFCLVAEDNIISNGYTL